MRATLRLEIPTGREPRGSPQSKWEDNIKMEINEMQFGGVYIGFI
jgi:hypothetical protein